MPVIAHTKLLKSRNDLKKQSSYLVCIIFIHIVQFLSYMYVQRKRKRMKKMNKIEKFMFGFSNLIKVRGTNRVDLGCSL